MPTYTPHDAFGSVADDENCDRKIFKKFSTSDLKATIPKIASYDIEDVGFYDVFTDKMWCYSLIGANFQNNYNSCKWLIVNVAVFKRGVFNL